MSDDLLPCPFCGGAAECRPDEVGSGGQHVPPYYAGCRKCGFVFAYEEPAEAITAWNTRHLAQPEAAEPVAYLWSDATGQKNVSLTDKPRWSKEDIAEYEIYSQPLYLHPAAPVAAQRAEGAVAEVTGWQMSRDNPRLKLADGVKELPIGTKLYLRPAPASGLAELAKLGSFQVDWTDDEPAQVGIWKITGSHNDREWHLVAQGESFHAAISALRGQP